MFYCLSCRQKLSSCRVAVLLPHEIVVLAVVYKLFLILSPQSTPGSSYLTSFERSASFASLIRLYVLN